GDPFALDGGEYLGHWPASPGEFLVAPLLQLLSGSGSGYLAIAAACRFEVARRHRRELLADLERSICFELGENVVDHPPNLSTARASRVPASRPAIRFDEQSRRALRAR